MKSNRFVRSAALVAALAATVVPVLPKPVNKTINISQNAKLGKADLQAGEYRLFIDGNKATVIKKRPPSPNPKAAGKIATPSPPTTPCCWAKTAKLREVRFSGQKRVFVFSE